MAVITSNSGTSSTDLFEGNWSAGSSWVGGVAPTSSDDAIIAQNAVITLTADADCLSLTGKRAPTAGNRGGEFKGGTGNFKLNLYGTDWLIRREAPLSGGFFTRGNCEVVVKSPSGDVSLTDPSGGTTPPIFYKLTIDSGARIFASEGSVANESGAGITVVNGSTLILYGNGITANGGNQGTGLGTFTVETGAIVHLGWSNGDDTFPGDTFATPLPDMTTYAFNLGTVRIAVNNAYTVPTAPTYGHLHLSPPIDADQTYTIASGTLNVTGDLIVSPKDVDDNDGLRQGYLLTVNMAGTWGVGDEAGRVLKLTGEHTFPSPQFTVPARSELVTRPVSTSYNIDCVDVTIEASGHLNCEFASTVINCFGDWTRNGDGQFTRGSSEVVLDLQTGTQTVTGAMTGDDQFHKLTVIGGGGADPGDCELTGWTPGIVFANAITTADLFTIGTNANVQFASGQTYTFGSIDWDGVDAAGRIYLRNSAASGSWTLTVTGSKSVAWVNVSRSNATSEILALVTSEDCGNNTNWIFAGIITAAVTGGGAVAAGDLTLIERFVSAAVGGAGAVASGSAIGSGVLSGAVSGGGADSAGDAIASAMLSASVAGDGAEAAGQLVAVDRILSGAVAGAGAVASGTLIAGQSVSGAVSGGGAAVESDLVASAMLSASIAGGGASANGALSAVDRIASGAVGGDGAVASASLSSSAVVVGNATGGGATANSQPMASAIVSGDAAGAGGEVVGQVNAVHRVLSGSVTGGGAVVAAEVISGSGIIASVAGSGATATAALSAASVVSGDVSGAGSVATGELSVVDRALSAAIAGGGADVSAEAIGSAVLYAATVGGGASANSEIVAAGVVSGLASGGGAVSDASISSTPGSIVVDLEIVANNDDGFSTTSSNWNGSSESIRLGRSGSTNYTDGFRFQDAGIPPGSEIVAATLRVYVWSRTGSGTVDGRVRGIAADNSPDWGFGSEQNPIALAKTTAFVEKQSWTVGEFNAINVRSIVQEIVDRAGWAHGNSLSLVISEDGSDADNFVELRAIEYSGGAFRATLEVDYIPIASESFSAAVAGGGASSVSSLFASAVLSGSVSGAGAVASMEAASAAIVAGTVAGGGAVSSADLTSVDRTVGGDAVGGGAVAAASIRSSAMVEGEAVGGGAAIGGDSIAAAVLSASVSGGGATVQATIAAGDYEVSGDVTGGGAVVAASLVGSALLSGSTAGGGGASDSILRAAAVVSGAATGGGANANASLSIVDSVLSASLAGGGAVVSASTVASGMVSAATEGPGAVAVASLASAAIVSGAVAGPGAVTDAQLSGIDRVVSGDATGGGAVAAGEAIASGLLSGAVSGSGAVPVAVLRSSAVLSAAVSGGGASVDATVAAGDYEVSGAVAGGGASVVAEIVSGAVVSGSPSGPGAVATSAVSAAGFLTGAVRGGGATVSSSLIVGDYEVSGAAVGGGAVADATLVSASALAAAVSGPGGVAESAIVSAAVLDAAVAGPGAVSTGELSAGAVDRMLSGSVTGGGAIVGSELSASATISGGATGGGGSASASLVGLGNIVTGAAVAGGGASVDASIVAAANFNATISGPGGQTTAHLVVINSTIVAAVAGGGASVSASLISSATIDGEVVGGGAESDAGFLASAMVNGSAVGGGAFTGSESPPFPSGSPASARAAAVITSASAVGGGAEASIVLTWKWPNMSSIHLAMTAFTMKLQEWIAAEDPFAIGDENEPGVVPVFVITLRPQYRPTELCELQFTIVPRLIEGAYLSRDTAFDDVTFDLAIQKRLADPGTDHEEVGNLMAFVERVREFMRTERKLVRHGNEFILMDETNEPAYSEQHLNEARTFTSVISATYRTKDRVLV
jgi:hypothetical protein